MKDLPLYLAIAGFFVMGICAIAKPHIVTSKIDIVDLTVAGRTKCPPCTAALI
jgi:hypothetical protein